MKPQTVKRVVAMFLTVPLFVLGLVIQDTSVSHAATYSDGTPIVVGSFTWEVQHQPFGIQEVETGNFDDGMDATTFIFNETELGCGLADMELIDPSIPGISQRVTCDAPSVVGASDDLDFTSFIDFFEAGTTPLSADGDLARTIVSIENSGDTAQPFSFGIDYNFGEGYTFEFDGRLRGNSAAISIGNGAEDGSSTLPVAAAVGSIPGAVVVDEGSDDFWVERVDYELAPGETLTVAYFHRVLDPAEESDIDVIPAKLHYDALPEFSSFSGRISLGLDAFTSVIGWSDLAEADRAVGDVSSAMRYDTNGPYGAPVGFADPDDEWDFDDNGQYFDLGASFPINFFGSKAESICVTTNGTVFLGSGDDAFSRCSDNAFDRSVEELALLRSSPLIAPLGADINLEECPADENGNESRYFDGFGYPCSVYIEPEAVINGVEAVVVTWYRVGMYTDDNDDALFNTFQIVLLREETGNLTDGYDFRIEFNYGTIQDAEDGYDANNPGGDGCPDGGDCRWAVGWSDYDSVGPTADAYELFPNTATSELVDGEVTALTANSLNSSVPGRYTFRMVDGVTTGFSVPQMGPQPSNPSSPRPPTATSTPAIHLDLQVTVGQRISGAPVVVGGEGLAGGSDYSLVVRSTPQLVDSGKASSLGDFSKRVSMPALAPGSHTLTLTATAPNGSTLTLVQGFTVGSDGTVTAVGTPVGTIGSALAATGSNSLVMLWSVGLAMLLMVLGASALGATRKGHQFRLTQK